MVNCLKMRKNFGDCRDLYTLGIFAPLVLERYDNQNEMDKEMKLRGGVSLMCHGIMDIQGGVSQLDSFGHLLGFLWIQIWERLKSFDGKVQKVN
jgi:hypothetical protein